MIHIDFHTPADVPPNEEQRQKAVERSGVLKRRNDPALQKLVDEAAKLFHTPMAAVTIIDREPIRRR